VEILASVIRQRVGIRMVHKDVLVGCQIVEDQFKGMLI
jgi:hypothetical protein